MLDLVLWQTRPNKTSSGIRMGFPEVRRRTQRTASRCWTCPFLPFTNVMAAITELEPGLKRFAGCVQASVSPSSRLRGQRSDPAL